MIETRIKKTDHWLIADVINANGLLFNPTLFLPIDNIIPILTTMVVWKLSKMSWMAVNKKSWKVQLINIGSSENLSRRELFSRFNQLGGYTRIGLDLKHWTLFYKSQALSSQRSYTFL